MGVKVKNIDLSSNSLSDKSGVSIGNALKNNMSIEILNFKDNNFHNETGHILS